MGGHAQSSPSTDRAAIMITPEQWAAAAADHGISVEELRAKIAEVDAGMVDTSSISGNDFDRDLDPITFGEWAVLFESPSYKYIARTLLPNWWWVATIWQGINGDFEDPPVVMETSAFLLDEDMEHLPPPAVTLPHRSLEDALLCHAKLVKRFSQWVLPAPGVTPP